MAKKDSGNARVEPQRIRIEYAKSLIAPVLKALNGIRFEIAGEIRRGLQEVRSAIIICDASRNELLEMFPGLGPARNNNWINRMLLENEFPCYLCTAFDEEWGAKMIFMTGPWNFRSRVCFMAKEAGFKLNYRGLWRLGSRYAGRSEEQIFTCLDMPFIEPADRAAFRRSGKTIRYGVREEDKPKHARKRRARKRIGLGYHRKCRPKPKKGKPASKENRDPASP